MGEPVQLSLYLRLTPVISPRLGRDHLLGFAFGPPLPLSEGSGSPYIALFSYPSLKVSLLSVFPENKDSSLLTSKPDCN